MLEFDLKWGQSVGDNDGEDLEGYRDLPRDCLPLKEVLKIPRYQKGRRAEHS